MKEQLRKMYWEDRMSATEIGNKLDEDSRTILKWMNKYRIPRRDNNVKPENWDKPKLSVDGYMWITLSGHPISVHSGKVFIHRLMAWHKNGKYLPEGSVVHHINGNKLDNRYENLEIFESQKEHISNHRNIKNGRFSLSE